MKREILEFIAAQLGGDQSLELIGITAARNEAMIHLAIYNPLLGKNGMAVFNKRTLDQAASGDEKAVLYAKQKINHAAQGKYA